MGREIEVKIKLDQEDELMLRKWLKNHAKKVGSEVHEEHYLNNLNSSYKFENKNGYIDADTYFRVRFLKDNKAQVNLKKFKIDQVNNKSENIGEFEFYSDNASSTLALIEQLGFTDRTIVKKVREIFICNKYEIVIDNVEGLGSFAEFELKEFDENQNTKELFAEVFKFIKSIGFKAIKEQKRGYVSMLWNPTYEFTIVKDLE